MGVLETKKKRAIGFSSQYFLDDYIGSNSNVFWLFGYV
jgi:hypothetical protein